MQILVIARPAGRQEVLHVQAGAVAARPRSGRSSSDQFVALALERLEALIAHRGPALGAVEEIADHDVQRRRRCWERSRWARSVGRRDWRLGRGRPRRRWTASPSPPVSSPRTSKTSSRPPKSKLASSVLGVS